MSEKRPDDEDFRHLEPAMKQKKSSMYALVLKIRITKDSQQRLGLHDPYIIQVSDPQYVRDNGETNAYLKSICECVFETEDVVLMRTEDGGEADDDSSDWNRIDDDVEILGGIYLLKLPRELKILDLILILEDVVLRIDPVLIVKERSGSRSGSGDRTPMLPPSPSPSKIRLRSVYSNMIERAHHADNEHHIQQFLVFTR